jgi:hypothetical protein
VTVVRVVALAAFWFYGSTAVVQPQVPLHPPEQLPVGTGAISGVVTDGHGGRPVAGALVQLLTVQPGRGLVPQSRPRQMTDGSGRFVFQQLAAGSYSVRVTAPGYLNGGFGRVPGSGAVGQITLQDRQWFGGANAVLWKPASISGTIRDERGEPLVDVPVRFLLAFGVAGRDQWASGAVTQTDDRGAYRFAGLLSGRYVVQVPSMQVTLPDGEVALYRSRPGSVPLPAIRAADGVGTMAGYFAVPPPGRGQVYPATFCPAARSLSTADVIAVDFGSQRSAVDVSLVPVSSVRVSGVVAGPAAAITNLPVRLLAAGNESLGFGGETALTKTDMAGRFTLAQVPQGDYTLVVGRAINEFQVNPPDGGFQPSPAPSAANPFLGRISGASVGGEPGLFVYSIGMGGDDVTGRVSISVGTDAIDGLVVPTTAGVSVSGHALFDGADAPAAGRAAGLFGPMIRLDPADGDITRTMSFSLNTATPPGPTFSIANVMPGRYRLLDFGNRDYRLVGATWNGRDLFATPLEVTGEGPVTGIVVYLSSKRSSVSGFVRASDGQAASAGAVLIFPQDRDRWREPGVSAVLFRSLDVSADGAFSTLNLRPGDYFIAAVPVQERRRGLDIGFLTLLAAQATRITLDESATLTVDLRVIGGRR